MNRILLDQGLAPRTAAILRQHGLDAVHVSEIGMESVVLLRVRGLDAQGQADLIRSVCLQCETALSDGAAVSADRESIRIRRLPLR